MYTYTLCVVSVTFLIDLSNSSIENNTIILEENRMNSFINDSGNISILKGISENTNISERMLHNVQIFVKKSPPEIITSLYNTLTDSETKKARLGIPYEANVIQCILEQNHSLPEIFEFNISTIKPGIVKEAELYVYLLDSKVPSFDEGGSTYYLLRIYQVLSSDVHAFSSPDTNRLLNVHYVPVSLKGWQIFKVKRAVEAWINGTHPNLGFLITATTIFSQPVQARYARRHTHKDLYQPNLIIYNQLSTETDYPDIFQISKGLERKQIFKPSYSPFRLRTCQWERLYVSFEDLGWNFVHLPRSYPVNLCLGRCGSLYKIYQNSTPHAIMMNMIGNTRIPHCVPERLSAINILYYIGQNDIIFETIERMSVDSCHCR